MIEAAVADHDLATRMRHLLRTEGGFTLDVWTGQPAAAGLAVGTEPRHALCLETTGWVRWDDEPVVRWVRACRAVARRSPAGPSHHLGGWLPPASRIAHLDLVRVLPPAAVGLAHRIGVHHGQQAMFDLGQGVVVPVAGMAAWA